MRGGVCGQLKQVDIIDTSFKTTESLQVHGVTEMPKPSNVETETPQEILENLHAGQRAPFERLWERILPHLHAITFDFENALWSTVDIDTLANLLRKYEHRFSRHNTDSGHVTVDPFCIILKHDARGVKQRPYHHSPGLEAKVQDHFEKLVLAGIRRKSHSNWSHPWW